MIEVTCHCGAVRFEVLAPDEAELVDCNCSMCAKTGYLHLIVPKSRFRLLSSEANLTTYTFNTGYNADTDVYEDMVKAGIIDPAKVTRSALQNAASIAKNILTTECIVADKPEPAGGGGGMGGGMPPGMM